MTEHRPDDDLSALDQIARRAARELRDHVALVLDVEGGLDALPAQRSSRSRPRARIAAIAAVAALVAGGTAVLGQPGGDRLVRADLDEVDLEPTLLRPAGPRDGKDSVQLPLTVEPSSGLHDGDVVTVSAAGFVPGESVGLVQCAKEAGGDTPEQRGGVDGCYIGDYVNVTADEAGVARGTYAVHRVLTTPLTGTVDCAAVAERCIVAMGAIDDYDRSGGHAISFATDGEPVSIPTVEISPAEDLADGEVVHVTGSGLTPNDVLGVEVCSSDPQACWQIGERVEPPPVEDGETDTGYGAPDRGWIYGLAADATGHLSGDVRVWRFLPGPEPGTYVDCAVSRCSLRLRGTTAPPTVPLHFAPGGEAPASPVLAAAPTTDLAPGDRVLVQGNDFPADSRVIVMLCEQSVDGPGDGFQSCVGVTDEGVLISEDGAFSTEVVMPDLDRLGESVREECDAGTCTTVVTDGGGGGGIHCDGVTKRCFLFAEQQGFVVDDGEPPPPVFPTPPVPVSFR